MSLASEGHDTDLLTFDIGGRYDCGVAKESELLQGTLDLLILRTLELHQLHGVGIADRIEQVTQGAFVVGVGFNQVNSFERDLRFTGTNTNSTISTSFLPFDGEYTLDGNGNLDALNDLPFAAFNGGVIEFFPEFLEDDPGRLDGDRLGLHRDRALPSRARGAARRRGGVQRRLRVGRRDRLDVERAVN